METTVYPKDVLPEMNYTEPEIGKCCGKCRNSVVTNAGARIPGLRCKHMVKLAKKKGIKEHVSAQVNEFYGICDYYNKPFKAIMEGII